MKYYRQSNYTKLQQDLIFTNSFMKVFAINAQRKCVSTRPHFPFPELVLQNLPQALYIEARIALKLYKNQLLIKLISI